MMIGSLALALPMLLLGAVSASRVANSDELRVADIARQGVDLSVSHFVSFRLVFECVSSAVAVSEILSENYQCSISPGRVSFQVPGENELRTIEGHIVLAVRRLLLEPERLKTLGMQNSVLARSESGYYLGWELSSGYGDA